MKVFAVSFIVLVMASLVAATFSLTKLVDFNFKATKAEQKAARANQSTTVPPQTRNINETVTTTPPPATPVTNNGSRIVWVQQMVYVPVLVNDQTSQPLSLRSGGLKSQMGGFPSSIFKTAKAAIAAPPGKDSPYLAYSASNPPVVGVVASAKASSDDQIRESRADAAAAAAAVASANEVATESPTYRSEGGVDVVLAEPYTANVPVYGIGPVPEN